MPCHHTALQGDLRLALVASRPFDASSAPREAAAGQCTVPGTQAHATAVAAASWPSLASWDQTCCCSPADLSPAFVVEYLGSRYLRRQGAASRTSPPPPPPPPQQKAACHQQAAATAAAAGGTSALPQLPPPPWEPRLRREEVERGLAYYGSGNRLRRVAAKLMAGHPIKAYALGGSVTAGRGASDLSLAYPSRFFQFINATWPHRCAPGLAGWLDGWMAGWGAAGGSTKPAHRLQPARSSPGGQHPWRMLHGIPAPA